MEFNSIEDIKKTYLGLGCVRLYFKILQKNDNSKQQVYFGSNFSVLNIFINLKVTPDPKNENILKSPLRFSWLTENGELSPAPGVQIIFYPQYPEVRFSGFLRGSSNAPAEIMKVRTAGRMLFFGLREDGEVIGLALSENHPAVQSFNQKYLELEDEIFHEVKLRDDEENKYELIRNLLRVHNQGWVEAVRLDGEGRIRPCRGTNCGGYTLEALLGVKNNGISEPDFLGWEVKQFACTSFENPSGGAITLFTPEPNSGVYRSDGLPAFIRRYGYPVKKGKQGRTNFSSPHRFKVKNVNTNLILDLDGFDPTSKKITDVRGGIVLRESDGTIAAKWDFSSLMEHWNKKHNQAVYIPSKCKKEGAGTYYSYGHIIMLGEGTDFLKFLESCVSGEIYYDPGIKLEDNRTKARSQFRIKFKSLSQLYAGWNLKNLAPKE